MRVNLYNTSPLPRTHWTSRFLTVPKDLAAPLGEELTFLAEDGRRFRAVKGETVGGSTAIRVRVTMGGHELIRGEVLDMPHPDAGPFTPHPWARDGRPTELIPRCRFRAENQTDIPLAVMVLAPTIVDSSPAHQLWHMRSKSSTGEILEWWVELNHDDPVAQFWGSFTWSDRGSPAWAKAYTHVVISCGEQLAFDFRVRNNCHTPAQEGDDWGHMVARRPALDDGTALPLSGAMLCYASPRVVELEIGDEDGLRALVTAQADLSAAVHGPIVGVCLDWDGHYGACGKIPQMSRDIGGRDIAWDAFLHEQTIVAGYSPPRAMGASRTPSQTGGQQDFGAVKGTDAVTFGDPRWIRRAQYAVQAEMLRRSYRHYEANGKPLDVVAHPGWTTYAALTFDPLSRQDKLGKVGYPSDHPATEWKGYDEEHVTLNTLAAYLTLTHDPSLLDHVGHMLTVMDADARPKFGGVGATRAQGRNLGALAQLSRVSDDPRSVIIITTRAAAIAKIPTLAVPGPMKVLEGRGADARKKIWTDGSRTVFAPWCSMWEHGLAAVGFQQAVRATTVNLPALRVICETLAEFGMVLRSDGWWTTDDILWSGGAAPPGWPDVADWHIVRSLGARGTARWTRAGIMVAYRVLGDQHPLGSKMKKYIVDTGGWVTDDQDMQEWAVAAR